MIKVKKVIIIILFIFIGKIAISQVFVGISVAGVAYHPIEEKNKNAQFYKWKFDKKGKFVAFGSLSLFVSYKINNYLGLKFVQTFVFHDCAGKFAGITHFGINFYDDILAWKNTSNQFSLSFGPFWYYRKNWMHEPLYNNDPNFIHLSKDKIWETKFVWYGGQIEFAHAINYKEALTLNFLPGYPYLYTFGLGIKQSL